MQNVKQKITTSRKNEVLRYKMNKIFLERYLSQCSDKANTVDTTVDKTKILK